MEREQAIDLCEALAADAIARLRRSNEAWDTYHGVPPSVSEQDYLEAEPEVADALWRRTGFKGARLEVARRG